MNLIARMRSQYSRFFLFSAALGLLGSLFVSHQIQKTFSLVNKKSGISADFSHLFRFENFELNGMKVGSEELNVAEAEISKKIISARSTPLSESPVLVPIQVVREIHGPSPYRWVRVRFDLNDSRSRTFSYTHNWIQVTKARTVTPAPRLAEATTIAIDKNDSLTLAAVHSMIQKKLSTQSLDTQPIVNPPVILINPIPVVGEETQTLQSQLQVTEKPLPQDTQALIITSPALDEIPTMPEAAPTTIPIKRVDKVSIVKTIQSSIVRLLPKSKKEKIEIAKTEPQSRPPEKLDTQFEAVEKTADIVSNDLDSQIQTIEYSDLPAPSIDNTPKLAEIVRVEKESERIEEEQPTEKAGPVLLTSFDQPIVLSQSSSVRAPTIQELVEKVDRLKPQQNINPPTEATGENKPITPHGQTTDAGKDSVAQKEPSSIVSEKNNFSQTKVESKESGNSRSKLVSEKSEPNEAEPENTNVDAVATTQSIAAQVVEPKKTCDTALIGQEAFSATSDEPISVCRRVISHEGSSQNSKSRWWEVRESVNHWPTLIYQKADSALKKNERIPILSLNTVKVLSTLSKTRAQAKTAGIIVGEVPPGIQVTLSGRSESVLYFDSYLRVVDSRDAKGARYFAFLNVEPGLPLLNVTLKSGNGSGTIALLVQSGTTTYVRVPSPRIRKLSGTLFDAKSRTPSPVVKANIQVVGQSGKQAVSNKRGEFEIGNVLTFDEHPLYLDVSSGSKEFRHRYRINPEESKGVMLFRFNSTQVSNWIQQLEGGVSPMSGLIVGAVPGLLSVRQSNVEVKIGTLDRKSVLRPEVYALGASDLLQDTNKMNQGSSRFLSVQVPEGPNIPSAFDSSGNIVWSEIVFSQPGVVNVVSQ